MQKQTYCVISTRTTDTNHHAEKIACLFLTIDAAANNDEISNDRRSYALVNGSSSCLLLDPFILRFVCKLSLVRCRPMHRADPVAAARYVAGAGEAGNSISLQQNLLTLTKDA